MVQQLKNIVEVTPQQMDEARNEARIKDVLRRQGIWKDVPDADFKKLRQKRYKNR